MDFKQREALYRSRAEQALRTHLQPVQGAAARLGEAMAYTLYGKGKRVRPVLLYAAADSVAGSGRQKAVADESTALDKLAAAIEMIHAYSLIHDDLPCMDNDDMRRGRPTCHVVYGEAQALLAGDALQCRAFELCLQAARCGNSYLEAACQMGPRFGQSGMAGGQAIDLESEGKSVDLETLREMDRGKTSALIEAAVLGGAAAAGATQEMLSLYRQFAEALGLAFQICDDCLDASSDSETMGKTVGKDARDDKSTYVSLLGLESARVEAERETRRALESLAELEKMGLRVEFLREYSMALLQREH